LRGRRPRRVWKTLNQRVDFRDVSHEAQPNSKGPVRQHTDEQRRSRVDSGLPLEPFALADF
jgi:hypothetical protein